MYNDPTVRHKVIKCRRMMSWRVLRVNFPKSFGMIRVMYLMFANRIDVCPYDRPQQ